MARAFAARVLSVIGHPALLMPGAVAWAATAKGAPPETVRMALAASVFVAVCVMAYSTVQVRLGRWRHVDASLPGERRQLNTFLIVLLFGVAAFLWWSGQHGSAASGLGIGGALVAFTFQLRRRLKVSLHAAFAVFAAALLWPDSRAVLLGLALALGVSWSRLALRRHTPAEVVVGLLAGGVAGLGFNLVSV